jgi:hypothetical protein
LRVSRVTRVRKVNFGLDIDQLSKIDPSYAVHLIKKVRCCLSDRTIQRQQDVTREKHAPEVSICECSLGLKRNNRLQLR